MDIPTDVWGQIALEANQMYLSDGTKRSPFADTVNKSIDKKYKVRLS